MPDGPHCICRTWSKAGFWHPTGVGRPEFRPPREGDAGSRHRVPGKADRDDLTRYSLISADLTDALLDGVTLRRTLLLGANLSGARIAGALLDRTIMTGRS